MPRKSEEYWQRRFEQILISNEKTALEYEREMAKIYEEVKQELQKELESFYQRYAKENNLDLAEVKKKLNAAELKRFKTQQKIYLEKVRKLIEQGADLTAYEEVLKKLSARAYVSRLQELQYNLNTQINLLTGEQQVKMTDVLNKSYTEGYLKTVFEIHKGMGFGYSFNVPNTDDVAKVLKTPWNGDNYSGRIWQNKDKLTQWLNNELPRHFARGSGVQEMGRDLSKKLQTNYTSAVRLVRTEVNHISNESSIDGYEASGVVKQYQILATLDSRTSEICRDMDGKVFKISEKRTGVTVPPFHVNCRTTTIPYFQDMDDEDSTRVARDESGRTYRVPGNMTYKEWLDLNS